MNIDLNRVEQPQYGQMHMQQPVQPQQAPRGTGIFMGFVLGMGVVIFGVVCLIGGMYFVKYNARLDQLERSAVEKVSLRQELAERGEQFPSYPSKREVASRNDNTVSAMAPAAPMAAPAAAQPQIYLMMGGQQAGYGAPAMAYPSMPAYYQPQMMPAVPPYMQPSMQTDLNQYIMAQYQAEFAEFIRQRATQAPARPAFNAPAPGRDSWTFNPIGAEPVAMRRSYIATDIAVPEKMTLDLKRRFSRSAGVEDWLREETAAPKLAGDSDDDSPAPDVDLQMDDVLRGLAESTFADKQYDRTARVYAELAARSVNLTVVELMRWSKAAELSGDPDSALRILDLVLKIDPENIDVLREAAQLSVSAEMFSAGAEYYLRLMEAQPDEREWRMMRAKTLTWSGRGREAVDLFRELHVEEPTDWELNLMLADLLLSLDQYEESLPLLDALIANDPENESLINRKMNALMALQRFKEAAVINAQLLELHPEDTELLLKLAVNLVAAQQFAASIEPFQLYLDIKPEDIEVRKQYAEALMAANQFRTAAQQYRVILAEKGFADTGDVYKKKLANALMAGNDFPAAAGVYRELAASNPMDAEMNMGLVVSLRMSGQIKPALAAARTYLAQVPYDEKMLAQAGEMAMETKDTKSAIKWFRTALKMAPDDVKSRINLAHGLMTNMEYEPAEAEFRRALLYSDEDEARLGLARALFYQRKYTESFKEYKSLAAEDINGTILTELKYREAVANGQEVEAAKHLQQLQELEPDEIAWRSDRFQGLLRQHRFPEARAQARVVKELNPSHRPTRSGQYNMRRYLTTYPVTLRAGLLRKSSKRTEDEDRDRQARLSYTYYGLHAEKSLSDFWRVFADVDRERWNMRESDVSNASSYKLKLGGMFEGHPNLKFKGDLGYRWFIGSDKSVKGEKRGIEDQWLYNLRAEMVEIGGQPFTLGLFSGRREHYDNYNNVYDDLYAYDFGVDGHYRWRKWNFNAELVSSVLSDTNTRMFFHGDAKYRLYETPCMLITLGGNIEYESWNNRAPTYYSPKDMYKYGIDLDGRYYFCRDPEVWGGCESYMDFGISIYRDRFSSTGQKFYLGVSHDYGNRLSAFARIDFSRESYYNEVKLLAGVTYKFGGCE